MTTTLTYTIEPAQVFVATTTSLTLTAMNPVSGSPVVFEGGRDPSVILITIPVGSAQSDLSAADTFTANTSTTGFTIAQRGNQYQISSNQAQTTLNPGESIVVTFSGVEISATTGTVEITLDEYIGYTGVPGNITISKVKQKLGVYAWIDPLTVGENGISTLWWQSTGGTKVTIAGSSTQPFPSRLPGHRQSSPYGIV